MEVILIRPQYNLASSLYAKAGKGGVKESYPSLGLHYLAAKLTQGGFSVEIIDGLFVHRQYIFSRVKKDSPRLIGIYVTSSSVPEVIALINGLRLASSSPIVLGGPHITHCPESIHHFRVEYGIRGDAEESLSRLANFVVRGVGGLEGISGLIFSRDDLSKIPEKASISDLDRLPFPEVEPAVESPYFFPLSPEKMTTMITSRGCPFDCVYCGLPNKRCFKARGIDNILSEIKINLKKGYKYIDFKDDIFTYDMSRVEGFCKRIVEEGIKFSWGCETRVDFLNEKLICLMKDAGCCNIKFGIESSVKRVQKAIGKIIAIDKAKTIFKFVKECKMDVIAYFSLGHPGERLSDMKETIHIIKELKPDYMDVTLCCPIPGSRLFDIAVREGKLPMDYWERVNEIGIMPIYNPDGVKLEDMRNLQKQAYRQFYFSFNYIFCQLCKIKSLRGLFSKIKIALLLWKEACR